jgi:hypothetical protein
MKLEMNITLKGLIAGVLIYEFLLKPKSKKKVEYVHCNYKRRVDTEYIFETRAEAENVLSDMEELIHDYGFVTVADFKNICGCESNFKDVKKVWTNLKDVIIMRVHTGYAITLPKPQSI